MNIIETSFPNITPDNIDESKLILSDKIIEYVYPLFDEIYISKVNENKDLEKELSTKKLQVKKKKEGLEGMLKEYNRQKKIKQLLDRISKLISSGLIYDNNLKTETIVILRIINKLSDEKLDIQLSETMKTINKRFSKSI